MIGCTGGWCTRREDCDAYASGAAEDDVRQCKSGKEKPVKTKRLKYRTIEDVKANCIVNAATHCWEWKGSNKGTRKTEPLIYSVDYERVCKRMQTGMRAVFQIAHERAPLPGYIVMRSCLNKLCLNPAHLSEKKDRVALGAHMRIAGHQKGTHIDARRENAVKGRAAQGIVDADPQTVIQIYLDSGTLNVLSKKYGKTTSAIQRIRAGITYRHITAGLDERKAA